MSIITLDLSAGLCLGLLYLGGLWWNVRLLASPDRVRMAIAIMAVRFAMLGGALVFAAAWQGARPLLAMGSGILAARFLVIYRIQDAA